MNDKKSFFERLTGSINVNEEDGENAFSLDQNEPRGQFEIETAVFKNDKKKLPENEEEGQLTIDMHQTPHEIIIHAFAAGVKPEDLDVSISRDMVTIRGKRNKTSSVSHDNYFYQELYWGAFSRSIILPQEIDPDNAEANLKNGVLVIILPKLDKNKTQKIKVKND